jgi:hypothetical protein
MYRVEHLRVHLPAPTPSLGGVHGSARRPKETRVSFLDYLKENRGLFIDHRAAPPTRPGTTAQEAADELDEPAIVIGGGSASTMRRRRRPRTAPQGVRFRHIRPAFSPSPYSDPLPYEEPWERVFR